MPSPNAIALAAMWTHMTSLTPQSSAATVAKIADFFSPTATVYLSGMGQPPSTSHAELIANTKKTITYWAMEEHKIVTSVESPDSKVIVNAMDNKLRITGELVENFRECEVLTFDAEGKISRYELYVDSTPIQAVFAKKQAKH